MNGTRIHSTRLIAATALCLTLVSQHPAGGDGTPRGVARKTLDELLEAQASAFERFDVDAYIETIVPERRDAERRIFLRSRLLPLTEMQIATQGDPRPGSGPDRLRVQVELIFRLDGQPANNPFSHSLVYVFASTGGEWLVEDIVDDQPRPLPWRQGELEVHRTHHFLIYTRPEMRADMVELAEDAEAAYATLYRRHLPLASGYLIHFADGREFARLSGGLPALGLAIARNQLEEGHYEIDSRAFYINGSLFSERERRRLTPETRRVTVAHELAHLALAAQSRPFTPPWLKEGAAVYFSGGLSFDANRRLVRAGMNHLSLEEMTRARALGQHGLVATAGQQAADEYLFSGNVVAFLIEKHGQDKFLNLYRSYAELPPERVSAALGSIDVGIFARVFENTAGELATQSTVEALGRIYGLTLAELEAEVKKWLRIPHR